MDRVLPAFNEGFPAHTFTMAANTGDAIHMVEDIGGPLTKACENSPVWTYAHPLRAAQSLAGWPEMVMVTPGRALYQ